MEADPSLQAVSTKIVGSTASEKQILRSAYPMNTGGVHGAPSCSAQDDTGLRLG